MKELVYQARRAHAGRKEPVRQQCDRARIVDRTRTPLRRSPRFLKPALLVDPPAPGSESGDLTSSEVAQEPTCSRHPSQPVFPFVGPQLQGNNDHVGGVGTMLVDPPLGHEDDVWTLTSTAGRSQRSVWCLASAALTGSASTSMLTATAAATAAHPPCLAQLTEQLTCLFEAIDHSVRPTTRRRGCRQLWPPAVTRVRAGHARARTMHGLDEYCRASSLATVGLMPSPLSMIMHRLTYLSTPADRVAGAIDHLHVTPRASEPFPQDKSTRLPPAPAPAVTRVQAGHARELLLSESLGRGLPSAFRIRRLTPPRVHHRSSRMRVRPSQDFVYPSPGLRPSGAAGP
ncbi:hypothetical protein C8R46DRAFT_1228046 [Mycena filopes]|nr:hypothetical protein C8R46DRAFT_1228046 [Mycena filopes]